MFFSFSNGDEIHSMKKRQGVPKDTIIVIEKDIEGLVMGTNLSTSTL